MVEQEFHGRLSIQDLVLLKKGLLSFQRGLDCLEERFSGDDEENGQMKEAGSQKKVKKGNKKNVIPASEWFQG